MTSQLCHKKYKALQFNSGAKKGFSERDGKGDSGAKKGFSGRDGKG